MLHKRPLIEISCVFAAAAYYYLVRRRRRTSFVAPPFKAGAYGLGRHDTAKGAVVIRLAEADDAPQILSLIHGLAIYTKEPVSLVEVTEHDLRRDGFGDSPRFRCILAQTEDDQAVGFAFFYPTYSSWQGPCIYLEDLFVRERYRSSGIGGLLLKTTAAFAFAQGCKRLHWNALDWNTKALDFYTGLGATHLADWITLRLYRPDMANLLGLSV